VHSSFTRAARADKQALVPAAAAEEEPGRQAAVEPVVQEGGTAAVRAAAVPAPPRWCTRRHLSRRHARVNAHVRV